MARTKELEDYQSLPDHEKRRRHRRMADEFCAVLVNCLLDGSVQTIEDIVQLYWSFQHVRGIPYNAHINLKMFLDEARLRAGTNSGGSDREIANRRLPKLITEAAQQLDENAPMPEEPEYGARVIDYLVDFRLFNGEGKSKV